jgi:hypothetical protein
MKGWVKSSILIWFVLQPALAEITVIEGMGASTKKNCAWALRLFGQRINAFRATASVNAYTTDMVVNTFAGGENVSRFTWERMEQKLTEWGDEFDSYSRKKATLVKAQEMLEERIQRWRQLLSAPDHSLAFPMTITDLPHAPAIDPKTVTINEVVLPVIQIASKAELKYHLKKEIYEQTILKLREDFLNWSQAILVLKFKRLRNSFILKGSELKTAKEQERIRDIADAIDTRLSSEYGELPPEEVLRTATAKYEALGAGWAKTLQQLYSSLDFVVSRIGENSDDLVKLVTKFNAPITGIKGLGGLVAILIAIKMFVIPEDPEKLRRKKLLDGMAKAANDARSEEDFNRAWELLTTDNYLEESVQLAASDLMRIPRSKKYSPQIERGAEEIKGLVLQAVNGGQGPFGQDLAALPLVLRLPPRIETDKKLKELHAKIAETGISNFFSGFPKPRYISPAEVKKTNKPFSLEQIKELSFGGMTFNLLKRNTPPVENNLILETPDTSTR